MSRRRETRTAPRAPRRSRERRVPRHGPARSAKSASAKRPCRRGIADGASPTHSRFRRSRRWIAAPNRTRGFALRPRYAGAFGGRRMQGSRPTGRGSAGRMPATAYASRSTGKGKRPWWCQPSKGYRQGLRGSKKGIGAWLLLRPPGSEFQVIKSRGYGIQHVHGYYSRTYPRKRTQPLNSSPWVRNRRPRSARWSCDIGGLWFLSDRAERLRCTRRGAPWKAGRS